MCLTARATQREQSKLMLTRIAVLVVFLTIVQNAHSAQDAASSVQARMDADITAGKPLVAHVVVALCDNFHQRIVPVPLHLGNGNDPNSNLYWGAMYGVRTYFSRHDDWTRIRVEKSSVDEILDRVAFRTTIKRSNEDVVAYVLAEAWRGRSIEEAVKRFLDLSGGRNPEPVAVYDGAAEATIEAGGSAHLIAYVGHNGLMDFAAPGLTEIPDDVVPRSSIVLACESEDYFRDLLESNGSHSLITTTGLMAPEAYSLEAAISAWFSGESAADTRDRAAEQYARFQKANVKWAKKLFTTDP